MFERPLMLWLLVLAPLMALPAIRALRAGRLWIGTAELLLRLLELTVFVLLLAGLEFSERLVPSRQAIVVALDQSRSMAPDQQEWMRAQARALAAAMDSRDQLGVIGFGRDVRMLAPLGDPRLLRTDASSADPGATDIDGALTTAAGLFAADSEKKIVLLTDGNETAGSARREMSALLAQGIRVFTAAPPPSATQRVALTAFDAPDSVRARASFALRLAVENEAGAPIETRIRLSSGGQAIANQSLGLRPGLNRFELPYQIAQPGAYILTAEMEVPSPAIALNAAAETALSVTAPPRLLIASNEAPSSVLNALKLRDYGLDLIRPEKLSARAEDYLAYQAVVIADSSAISIGAAVQKALNRYVSEFGGGLLVTGEALRDDKFANGALESALPIRFKPQPPPPNREPVAIYLCIDRSNSMSYNSRYPAVRDSERIRYAKQAAIALLRQLDDTDYAGVIAFDSQPYVLARLHPVGQDRTELETRVERLAPGGGTDFKEALEIAKRDIVDSRLQVRQVILLTDGDTNRQYHDHDDLIAGFARERIPVSTIRIGPDLANLRLLEDFAQATGGVFYRVQDIEKLPQIFVRLTRHTMSQTSQSKIRIRQQNQSSILSGIKSSDIPPLDFYTTTEAKEGASVPLRVERAEAALPLLAAWQYGLGRSAIFAADPDSLASLSWIHWDHYAEFWSQLVTWVMRSEEPGPFSLKLARDESGAMVVNATRADTTVQTDSLFCRITGTGRALDVPMTQDNETLFHGDIGPLARGFYTATLLRKGGDREQVIASQRFAVAKPSTDAMELRLRPPDLALLRDLAKETDGGFAPTTAKILNRTGATVVMLRTAQPYLVPLAILLILAETFVRRRLMGPG